MRPIAIAPFGFGSSGSFTRWAASCGRELGTIAAGLLLAAAAPAAVAGPSQLPQTETLSCFGCNLGIFDQPELTSNRGVMAAFTPKDIYVGVQYEGSLSGLTGIEFSIAGIRAAEDGIQVLSADQLVPGLTIGSPQAPADTSATSVGIGGMNAAWASCLNGNRALMKITLLGFGPISKVITLKHKYPTSNQVQWHTPVIVLCDIPVYTAVRVTGGCYGINMPPGPLPCDAVVAVDRTTWSRVKSLYN